MLFRLTRNVAEQIHEKLSTDETAENRYCEWIVDIVLANRKKSFIITNAYSCFSIVVPAKGLTNSKKFSESVIAELKLYFDHAGLSGLFDTYIMPNVSSIKIAKTNNKSVTGIRKPSITYCRK